MRTLVPTRESIAACAIDAVKVYGKGDLAVRALDGVTVDFPSQQLTAVMGPSGSGKSTLMHCLAGLDSLTSGTIQLGGIDLSSMTEKERTIVRRDHVGFVFQAFNLVPTLTAMENIELPAALGRRHLDPDWMQQIIGAIGLQHRFDHRPSQLSGGEQQRVAIARALAGKPEIVFADEPTGNLDSRAAAEILTFLQRAVEELGQTIVMVTHDPSAASYGGRVLFLADGRIVGEMLEPTVDRVLERLKTIGA
jgi:putative ABC transport system ATP-binding protein